MCKKYNVFLIITIILFMIFFGFIRYNTKKEIQKNEFNISMDLFELNKKPEYKKINTYINDLNKRYDNNDIVGILNIDSLDIYLPILQGEDNKYYSKHLIDGKIGYSTIFADYRTNFKNSKQINIYGQNSNLYNLPFKNLIKYTSQSFFNDNQYFEIHTLDSVKKYQIFSVEIEKGIYEYKKISFNSIDDWELHFNKLKSNSVFKTSVDINGKDNIVILQTNILSSLKGSALVICAKEVDE